MERHEEVFFSLLRSAMWGTPVELPHDFKEWGRVFNLAKSQSVLALVADVVLSDREINSRFSEKTQEKLRSFMMANMMTADRLSLLIVKYVSLLRDSDIAPVLMKGHSLAQFYPKPKLRQCGDIDLYVGVKNYEKAYEVMKKSSDSIDDPEVLKIGQHFSSFKGGLEVEVHRYAEIYPSRKLNVVYQVFSKNGLATGLVPMIIDGVSVNTPSDTYNCYYLFSHLFNHFLSGGIGFRQLMDWALFIFNRSERLNIPELEDMIKRMGMMRPWQAFGCVLVKYLNLPAESFPFYNAYYEEKDVDKIARTILDEGNFGHQRDVHTKKRGHYFIDKTRSFFGHISRTAGLLSLFPSLVFRRFFFTMYNRFSKVLADIRIGLKKK